VAGAGLEPATTSVRSCSSSGICPQAAQTPTRVQEMFTYSTRLSYPPANRQGGTRTRDPVISCAFGALRKSATSCKQLALILLPEARQLLECRKKFLQHNKNKR